MDRDAMEEHYRAEMREWEEQFGSLAGEIQTAREPIEQMAAIVRLQ